MNSKLKTSLSYVIHGGVATSAMDTLALGPILTGYAKLLGAGNIAFGVLSSIPYFGNLFHLLAAWLLTKGYSVRKMSIVTSLLSRPFYLMIALLAFWPTLPGAMGFMVFFLSCSYFIGCISGGCWLPWMKALIPNRIMGRFFARRFFYMQITKVICYLAASKLLDYVVKTNPKYEIYVYSFLFFLSFIIGLYGAYTFYRVDDKQVSVSQTMPFLRQILVTFTNKPFRLLLSALGCVNFGFAFISPFIVVFILNQLDIEMNTILILTLVSQMSYVFVIKTLGRIGDKKGSCHILDIAIILMIIVLLGLIGLNQLNILGYSKDFIIYLLYIIYVILGFATAGFNLGLNNTSLLYVPDENATIYLSVNSVFKSAAGALGSLIAGFVLSGCMLVGKNPSEISDEKNAFGWLLFFGICIGISVLGLLMLKCLSIYHKNNLKSFGKTV